MQALQAHKPLDPVEATVRSIGKQITPTRRAPGVVARHEAGLHLATEIFVAAGSGAGKAAWPGMEARPRHPQRIA